MNKLLLIALLIPFRFAVAQQQDSINSILEWCYVFINEHPHLDQHFDYNTANQEIILKSDSRIETIKLREIDSIRIDSSTFLGLSNKRSYRLVIVGKYPNSVIQFTESSGFQQNLPVGKYMSMQLSDEGLDLKKNITFKDTKDLASLRRLQKALTDASALSQQQLTKVNSQLY